MVSKEGNSRHDHAGGAVGALESAFVKERLLQGMEAPVPFQSFDGQDVGGSNRADGSHTGPSRLAVNENGTSSALPLAAAVFGTGQVKAVAQNIQQAVIRIGLNRTVGPIDPKRVIATHNECHGSSGKAKNGQEDRSMAIVQARLSSRTMATKTTAPSTATRIV